MMDSDEEGTITIVETTKLEARMETTDRCTQLMDLSACWADWRNGLKESIKNSRAYYQDEMVQILMARLDDFLTTKVCASSNEEQLMESMWEVATESERVTLATLLLKIADRV
jgi:hypothetical protein